MTLPGIPDVPMTPEGRRNWIRHNIPRNIWETVSGAAILNELQELGMGIAEGDFYAIRRDVLNLGLYTEQIAGLDMNSLVPRSWMSERPYDRMTMDATYRFTITVRDAETGEISEIHRSMSDDRHLTPQEAHDLVWGYFTSPTDESNYVIEGVQLSEVWVREGAILTR